jgi:hypothetical protein
MFWLLYLNRIHSTHWIGGWVRPRAGLDALVVVVARNENIVVYSVFSDTVSTAQVIQIGNEWWL